MSQPTTTTTAPSSSPFGGLEDGILKIVLSPNGAIIGACLLFIAIVNSRPKGDKTKSATSYFSGEKETANATRQAKQQIRESEHNSVALYIGRPTQFNTPPIYIPDAQRGTAVVGGPGSGKTFSIIDPTVRSAIDQDFPVILYDFKYPNQTQRIAGYAKEKGYDVRVFAPGFPESDVCNPLDFLKDETDSLMARQMAEVLNKNFASGGATKTEDPFFTQAGDQLTEAIFLLTKSIKEYPDIMMSQALLSLEDLPGRIKAASDQINPWVYSSFGQLLSVADSEKTVASIIATTNSNFTRFMKQKLLGAFCGKTTIPLDLDRKQLLIFGMDRERRDVVGPLLATVLHMIVNRNVVRKRKTPLILALDELPTLYLPALVQWLNENREDGLVCLLGFQNMAQLEKTYGKELARAIMGGCATKAIFNPQEYESAQVFSDFLGEEQLYFKQKSRGYNDGRLSSNLQDQEKTRKLFEPSRFLKLPTGHCVLLNPGYCNEKEAGVPLHKNVKLPRAEMKAVKRSESSWEQVVEGIKEERGKQLPPSSKDLKIRYIESGKRFPKVTKKSKMKEQEEKQTKKLEEFVNKLKENKR